VLTRARIERYRSLQDIDVKLGPFNALVGPNDSGKTAFLQALVEPQRAAYGEGVAMERMARTKPQIRLNAKKSDVWMTARGGGLMLGSGPNGHFVGEVQATEWWPKLRDQAFMRIAGPLALDPAAVAGPSPRGAGFVGKLVETRGRGAAAHLARAALGDRARYDAIQRGMQELSGGRVREVVLGEATEHGYPLAFRMHDGTVLPARELAEGLLVFFAFLCIVHRDDPPAVLLVEHPEKGVHPQRVHQVVYLLRSLAELGVQVILTTCSPGVLDACRPEEVLVFRRPDLRSATEIQRLPQDFARRANGATLGQIWAAYGEDGMLNLSYPSENRGRARS